MNYNIIWMRSGAEWLERPTANAEVVQSWVSSIPASSDTVEPEGRQMKQCWLLNTVHRKQTT